MIGHLLQPLVCERFKNDARYREGHLRVVNALPQRKVLGLHTPEMKMLAKQLSRGGGEAVMPDGVCRCCNGTELIKCFGNVPSATLSHEEMMIWGFLINLEKCDDESRFEMLSKFVPAMDNWAVCDAFCANAKWMTRTDKERLWSFLQQWFDSHREFEVRFAVVASMCYMLCDGWIDKVFRRIDNLCFDSIESEYRTIKGKPKTVQEGSVQGASPYYVRMGVAWLLATALAKFPDFTRSFVNISNLPEDVVKLYVRKARESFRTRTVSAL
ncbi:MAG: DNA alkylation repair protein [Bacteroidales bacterium]|nr:DNA alkylation repair protein [Bacteroidales bacterium]